MDAVQELAKALQDSEVGAFARGAWPYPVANLVHLLGLVMLVGGIGLLDLRLMGLFSRLPAAEMSRVLTPIAVGGLCLMVPSGFVMFAADAASLARSDTFRWKLGLIALALANAAAFRVIFRDRLRGEPGAATRLMAAASLGLWLWIAALGRLIAYA